MKNLKQTIRLNSTIILLVIVGLLIGSSMVVLASLAAKTNTLAANTARVAANTNKIVNSQTEILNAIKQVTDDTKLTAQQQTTIIICMLQVPTKERTTDVQAACRKQADSQTVATNTSGGNAQGTSGTSVNQSGSSAQPTPSTPTSQPNNPQTSGTPPPKAKPNIVQRIVNYIFN